MKKAAYLLLFVSGAALADETAILKCRAIADSAARLNCYDAIPAGGHAAAPAAAAPTVASAPAAPAPAAAAPASAPKAAMAAAADAERSFGLTAKKKEDAPPNAIESTIVGTSYGWGPGSTINLANGQVWRVIDGDEVVLPPVTNRKARIERNFFGTLFLVVEGTNHSPKVRRIR